MCVLLKSSFFCCFLDWIVSTFAHFVCVCILPFVAAMVVVAAAREEAAAAAAEAISYVISRWKIISAKIEMMCYLDGFRHALA